MSPMSNVKLKKKISINKLLINLIIWYVKYLIWKCKNITKFKIILSYNELQLVGYIKKYFLFKIYKILKAVIVIKNIKNKSL